MKLKNKLILIIFCLILVYSGIGYVIIYHLILPKNEELSRQMAVTDLQRCRNAMDEYLRHLASIAWNYGVWDDTWKFMQDKNQDYIDANLDYASFRDLDFDIILFYDTKGKLFWGEAMKHVNRTDDVPDKDALAQIDKIIREKYPKLLSMEHPCSGIIVDDIDSFIVASQPIIRSSTKNSRETNGVVIMGRWRDKYFLDELGKTVMVRFMLISLDDYTRKLYSDVLKALDSGQPVVFKEMNDKDELLFTYAEDINGRPVQLFEIIYDRKLYNENHSILTFFLIIISVIGIFFLLLLVAILQGVIIMPVLKLTDNIVKIKTTRKYSVDIETDRKDEIGVLTKQFNEMQRTLKEYDENLEKLVEIKANDAMASKKDTIIRLAIASEKKDTDTGKHIERISKYSKLLAEKYGLLASDCEIISWASILHDIGKIGTPDNILKKPGKLTDEEFKIMKEHTVVGWNILDGSESELLKVAREITLNHHERWDGKGYPNGLAGEQIPLAARIVSIVDVFDALLSKRVYKEAFDPADVISFFKENRGRNFDPYLVDLFLENFDQFMKIRKELGS